MKRTFWLVFLLLASCVSTVVLDENTTFYGVDYLGGTEIRFTDTDGEIRVLSGTLAHDTVIDDVYLKGKNFASFYSSGALKSGFLAASAEFNEIPFEEGTEVFFYENGSFMAGTLEIDTPVNDRLYTGGTYVELYDSGEVHIGTLAEFIPGIDMMQSEVREIELQFDIFGNVIRPLGY